MLGLAPTIEAAAIVLGIMGVGSGCLNVVGLSWLQARTDDRLLGRVMSIVVLASTGLGPLSYALSGMLVQWNSALTFALAGAIILLSTVLVSGSPAVRTLPQSPHAAPPKSGGRAVH